MERKSDKIYEYGKGKLPRYVKPLGHTAYIDVSKNRIDFFPLLDIRIPEVVNRKKHDVLMKLAFFFQVIHNYVKTIVDFSTELVRWIYSSTFLLPIQAIIAARMSFLEGK